MVVMMIVLAAAYYVQLVLSYYHMDNYYESKMGTYTESLDLYLHQ